jgi:hypothetical protein
MTMPEVNWFYAWGVIVLIVILGISYYTYKKVSGTTRQNTSSRKIYQDAISAVFRAQADGALYPLVEGEYGKESGGKAEDSSDQLTAATHALMVWTAVLASATIIVAYFAGFTLDAIRGQLEEMREARRPWVDFSGDIQLQEPLTVINGNITISLSVVAKNVGDSPAISAEFEAILYVKPWPSGDIKEIIAKDICHPRKGHLGMPFTKLILPHDTADMTPAKGITNEVKVGQGYDHANAWCSVCLRYDDTTGRPHTTGQIFVYIPDDSAQVRVPLSNGPVPGHLQQYTGKIAE